VIKLVNDTVGVVSDRFVFKVLRFGVPLAEFWLAWVPIAEVVSDRVQSFERPNCRIFRSHSLHTIAVEHSLKRCHIELGVRLHDFVFATVHREVLWTRSGGRIQAVFGLKRLQMRLVS
jgi:hypothetical protein